ncbi:Serpentine receptor [Trichinella pseudospiralis]
MISMPRTFCCIAVVLFLIILPTESCATAAASIPQLQKRNTLIIHKYNKDFRRKLYEEITPGLMRFG